MIVHMLKHCRELALGLAVGAVLASIALRHDAVAQSPRTAECFSATSDNKMAAWITTQLAAGKTSVVGGGGTATFFYCAW